jgi:hypothetical protein
MMWVDIGVTVLLNLRLTLFRPALPQLVDPNSDTLLRERKAEQQKPLLAVGGEVNVHSRPRFSSGNSRAFAITYSCNT